MGALLLQLLLQPAVRENGDVVFDDGDYFLPWGSG